MQVFQQHAPGHAVHHQVMDRQQQALAAVGHVHQRGAEQRAVGEVEAALRVVDYHLQLLRIGRAEMPGFDGLRRAIQGMPLAVGVLAEAQAQGVVTLGHGVQRAGQQVHVQRLGRLQQQRLVPVLALRDFAGEEAPLERRQGHFALGRAAFVLYGSGLGDGGQLAQGLLAEQVARADLQAGLAGAAGDLDGDDGIAAQLEEVVVGADFGDAQHLAPDARQAFFHGTARRHMAARRLGRLRQRLAVELAVGVQRHAFEHDDLRRHHVLRQVRRQGRAQARRQFGVVLRHHVGQQLLGAGRGGANHHHRFADFRLFQQARLDLAQFDAQAANLHLVVDAAEVFDGAVIPPARQVAGAIQAPALAEGIGDEALGGQPRAAVVTARQADAADIQLARQALGDRLQLGVQHVQPQVGDGPADGHAAEPRLVYARPVADVDGRLGGAVEVVQAGTALFEEAPLQVHRQRLAAAHHQAQRRAVGEALGCDEGLQHGGHEVQHADALFTEDRLQLRRIAMGAGRGHHQRGAGHQRPEELPHRDVETERGLLQHTVAAVDAELRLHPLQAVAQRGVAVAGALRPAGGAGGVDAVGEVVRLAEIDQIGRVFLGEARGVAVQAEHRHVAAFDMAEQVLLGQQQARAGILQHVGQALAGMVRIERHVGAAGLEHRQQGHDHFPRALGEHADQRLGADAEAAQVARQAVGLGIQFGVAEGLAGADQRRRIRRRGGLRLDQLVHAARAVISGGGGVPAVHHLQEFFGAEQRQVADGRIRALGAIGQQGEEMRAQALDAFAVEQVGGVGEGAAQTALFVFLGIQRQVELGDSSRRHQQFGLQAGHAVELRRAAPFVVEHHLEQWVAAQAALDAEGVDQFVERQVLAVLRRYRRAAHLFQQRTERQAAVDFAAQHLGVDEEADQPLHLAALAVGDRHADQQFGLAAVAV
ncbi:hypothetical protein D9M68_345270 [compost metagenome]